MKAGRKKWKVRNVWAVRFSLSKWQERGLFNLRTGPELCRMLEGCADDSARRILLGVGEGRINKHKGVKRVSSPKKKLVKKSSMDVERMILLAEHIRRQRGRRG
jgi:hypothetical protein